MKIFSDPKSTPTLNASGAWSALLTNALVFPGLGSLLIGKKIEGCFQMILSIVGFILLMYGMFELMMTILKFQKWPGLLGASYAWTLWVGFFVAALAWVWGMVTSLVFLKTIKTLEKTSRSDVPPQI
jgi:membrane associated rhomboid family serine protease